MNWRGRMLLVVGLALATGLVLSMNRGSSDAAPVAMSRTAASNYLVTFSRGTSSSTQARAITAAGAKLVSSIAPLSMDTIKVPAGSERGVLGALRANASVAGIALNRDRQSEGSLDPAYADQWDLPQIGWNQLYGSSKPRGSSKIAVLDTGVSSAGGDLRLGAGWSAFGTNPKRDPNGHGTAVASVAAAAAGNGIGVAGVDFAKTTILPVQVLNSNGLGLDSDIVKGVVWAADHHANVILMSFSNPGHSKALQTAANYAWRKGAVLVAATGNDGSTVPTYPAGDAKVMGVAGTDQTDQPWVSSNNGADTFLAAPATNIPADATDGSETSITGTSASAAMVAGAAALLMAKDPKATNKIVAGRLSRNADPVGTTTQTGNGRLNLARAFADKGTRGVTPRGAPGGGPVVGPYVAATIQLSSISVGAQTGTVNAGTAGSVTFTITINYHGGGGCGESGTFTVTGLPSGATGSFSPSNISTCPATSTLTVNTSASTPAGSTTFTVSVGGQSATGTLTVVGPLDHFAVSAPASVTAGSSFGAVTVTAEDSGNNTITSYTGTIHFTSTDPHPATLPGNYHFVAGDNGAHTFSGLALFTAPTQSISVSDTVQTSITGSTSVTVNPAAANKLVFGQQPTSALSKATISPAVTVKVEDTFNNVETADNATSVSLAIGTNGGTFAAGTLSGGGATTASSGIATFSSLSINNVGTNYTLAATATSLTGATSNAFNITARAITVTAQTNAKAYDATTSAAATPTVTSGTLAGGDTANFSETYDTKNVGSGKTLTPSGTVTDGNAGHNYSYTFVASTNGSITARALTVTGAANSKAYDATTSAATAPTITSGALQGSDTANFTETYDTKNVGTSKTLTPSGTVSDGNSGNNYSYTFVASTNGTITARALMVTGAANSKVYDATTSAATAPTITSGALQGSDTANFVETYNNKNVGSGKTLTPSGTVSDGNSGNNYSYTFVASTNGTITARALTVTAQANTKTYDATTSAATAPSITSGTLQGSDTANFSETYDTKNVGSGKTLTPSGTVTDGNSGNNYSYTFVASSNGVINARALTVTAQANTKPYDSTTSAATAPSITSGALQGSDTANFVETYDTKNVGSGKTLTPSGTVTDGNSGNNYSYTFVASTNGTITARALTVTGAANSKVYDATTSAATAPTITSGALQGSDTANFVETYNNKNVGSGKTLTPSGTVTDGNSGNNYSYTFVASTNGTITARALTVTGAANSKVYDATTSAATAPTITSGALQGSDTANFSETYDTKNVGTGKTLTPSGTVTDGNSGNNYTYTFVPQNNGTITARALTVTAQTNTKTYDATTSAAATPSITSGVLQGSDTANFSETYDTKNAGTGKTLTPSGTVTDGNSGNDYSYTFVNDTTGVINQRALTVTAQTNTKTYDSTTSAAAVPQITSGTLQGSDSANFTEVYANANAGTGKTLVPSGTVTDGNSGNNYSYTFANNTTGVINQRALTVTAQTNTKTYDSTTSAAAIPQITSGVLQGTDSANFTEAYGNANAGTGKTLTPSGTVTDGNGGNNYSYTFVNDTTGVINQRALTVTAQTNTKTYDSTTSAAAIPQITSGLLQGSDSANFTEAYGNANAGTGKTLTPSGTVTDGNGGNNYSYTFVNDTTGVINQRQITIAVDSGQTKVYGNSDPALTYTVTSGSLVGTDSFTGSLTRAAGENVGLYAITIGSVAISDGNSGNNYALTYNGANFSITQRSLTVTASGQSKTYGTSLSLGTTAFTTSGNEANTEQVTSVTLTSTSGNDVSTTAPVGTYSGDIVPSAATGSNGFLASNYNITYVNGDLTITSASFTKSSDVQIDGVPAVGTTLTITNAVFSPTPANRTQQWELCDSSGTPASCVNISGATGKTYTPVATDVGSTLRIVQTVSRPNYNDASSTSTASAIIINGDFATTTTVAINGTPTVDTQATITAGSYSPTPISSAYQWQLCDVSGNNCSNIGGATTDTYTPVPSDAGSTLRVVETVSKTGYNDGSSTSDRATVTTASTVTNTPVAVNGTPTVGTPTTLTPGTYTPSPTGRSYQWQKCDSSGTPASCANISGATNSTYTPGAGAVGSTLRVIETVTNTGYSNGSSTSTASALVVNGNFATNTAVSVNGTPTVAAATTLTAGSYTPAPASSSYQWQLCDSSGTPASCGNIGGATSSTYTPVATDVGSTLRVVETVSKSGYHSGGSTSAASPVVVNASFTTTTAVSINGTPTQGTATTLTPGTYTPTPTGQSYQWRLCDPTGANCANIGGATNPTYTPVSGDVGSTLRVVETVTKAGYNARSSTSGAVAVVGIFSTNTAVAINGSPTVGTMSTMTGGTYTPSPTARSYQWMRCTSTSLASCANISGATNNAYTPVAGDVGKFLRVVETVTRASYVNGGSTSAASAAVVNGTFVMNTQVAVFGFPKQGTASTITQGSYTPTPTSRTYQWMRCTSTTLASCTNISGATTNTYTPVAADVGKRLRVIETVSKAGFDNLSVTSQASAAVTT